MRRDNDEEGRYASLTGLHVLQYSRRKQTDPSTRLHLISTSAGLTCRVLFSYWLSELVETQSRFGTCDYSQSLKCRCWHLPVICVCLRCFVLASASFVVSTCSIQSVLSLPAVQVQTGSRCLWSGLTMEHLGSHTS